MSLFYTRNIASKRPGSQLTEDFRDPDRSPAAYAFSVDGMELTGDACRNLLKELSRSERPVLFLYQPGEGGDELTHEFLVRKLRRYTLSMSDHSPHGEATAFLRKHNRVRFGFELGSGTYFFETRVLGSIGEEDKVLLAEKPKTIYKERRRYPRYRIWTDHPAFLGWMRVQDISWNGLRILSETAFEPGDILENAQLSLPSVHAPESDAGPFPGVRIPVPGAVVSYSLLGEMGWYYGMWFEQEWDGDRARELAEFLFALRKGGLPLSRGR